MQHEQVAGARELTSGASTPIVNTAEGAQQSQALGGGEGALVMRVDNDNKKFDSLSPMTSPKVGSDGLCVCLCPVGCGGVVEGNQHRS